jgi:hypothetical protein
MVDLCFAMCSRHRSVLYLASIQYDNAVVEDGEFGQVVNDLSLLTR